MTFVEPVKRLAAGTGHYYVDGTGETIPGVTTTIKGFMPSEGLKYWAANVTAAYAVDHFDELAAMTPSERHNALRGVMSEERTSAAARGTVIHSYAEKLAAGETVEVGDELRPYVEQCARFLDEYDVEPLAVEACVYNLADGWSGTLDVLAMLGNVPQELADFAGERAARQLPWILDYKSSAKGPYPDHALQQCAYRHAKRIRVGDGPAADMPLTAGAAIVSLGMDSYRVHPVDTSDDLYAVFRHGQVVAAFNRLEDANRKAASAGKTGPGSAIGPLASRPPTRAEAAS